MHFSFGFVLALPLLISATSFAQCLIEDIIPGQYMVRLKKVANQPVSNMAALSEKVSADFSLELQARHLPFRNIFHETRSLTEALSAKAISTSPPTTYVVSAVQSGELAFINSHSDVDTVEPDCRVHLTQATVASNDPMLSQQWALQKIHAPEAWAINTGSKDIIVSVSDSGVDYLHEDLKDNMWINTNEIPANGIDDDGNGCIDDIYGCNLADKTGDPMPSASNSELVHGTHVAGIIGAVGNNGVGISGVSQHIRIMAAKGFPNSASTPASESDLIQTIYYSVNNGARVINCSWGRTGSSTQAALDAFKYASDKNVVVVVAAGNSNQDSSTFTPASIPSVITVAATDSTDQIATFSNWGAKIDVAAPGGKGYDSNGTMLDGIWSTLPMASGKYGNLIGTSMASPYVAGLAALLLSQNPKLTPSQVLQALRDGGDKIHVTTTGNNLHFDYIRINALGSLKLVKAAMTTITNPNTGAGNSLSSGANNSLTTIPNTVQNAFKGGGCGMVSIENSSSVTTRGLGDQGPWLYLGLLILPLFFIVVLRKKIISY